MFNSKEAQGKNLLKTREKKDSVKRPTERYRNAE